MSTCAALILAVVCSVWALPARASQASALLPPDWVTPVAVELRKVPPSDGLEELLWDTQTFVSRERVVRYRHGARRPVSAAGLPAASAIGIVFDPAYQTYTWHMLRILRGDARIDALPTAEIQQSSGATDEGVGMVRAKLRVTAFLHDVRVGDVVEYAYSIDGDQPALGGHFASRLELVGDYAVGLIEHRVLWPAERTLQIRAHGTKLEPERTRAGDRDVYLWRVRDALPVPVEAHTPASFDANPWVQLSEFESWADVVEWALPMYRSDSVTPELERLAASLRGDGSKSAAAERATRFVQDEVRYLGFEFGEGSLRPRPPDLVAARRFGDCKDKSLLLITLLRLLDVEAVPVLVSTYDGAAVRERLPSPYDFDHVIVRATLDGRPVWIDSTASYERGPLAERAPPPFAVALPIAAGVAAPEPIAEPATRSEPGTRVRELFELADTNGGALLQVSTLYRGADANRRRAELATADRDALQQGFLEFYTGLYGRMRVSQPLAIRDDEERNELEVQEFYAVDELWRPGAQLQLWSIAAQLVRPEEQKARRTPLALPHPVHLVHEIDVLLPTEVETADADVKTEGPGVESRYQVSYTSRHLHLHKEYRTRAAQIDVADLAKYGAALHQIDLSSAYWIAAGSRTSGDHSLAWLLALSAVPGAYFGWLRIRDGRARLRKRRFERLHDADAGEAPGRAHTARSLEDLQRHMSGLSCGCASPQLSLERAPARMLYMDRELWQQSARCAACEVRLTRYFVLDPGGLDIERSSADGSRGWATSLAALLSSSGSAVRRRAARRP